MTDIPSGVITPENPLGIGVNVDFVSVAGCPPHSLYVIPNAYTEDDGTVSTGYSCLGLEICVQKLHRLTKELAGLGEYGKTATVISAEQMQQEQQRNPLDTYYSLLETQNRAFVRHKRTGWRSKTGLSKQLTGLEGRVVEVVPEGGDYDQRRTFIVGKTGGWIPCHLEIEDSSEDGGGSADRRYHSVRLIK